MKITVTALYGCGKSIAPPDWNTSAIPRPYRLYYVVDGEAYYTIGGKASRLIPGRFYLFPSSMSLKLSQDEKNRLNHMYYDFMMTPAIVSTEPLSCSVEDHPLFPILMDFMDKSICSYRYAKEERLYDTVICGLEAFLSLFLEIVKPKKEISTDIARALEYIEENYAEEITVKDIAEKLYLDEGYFIKKFKKTMGTTPYAYIKNLRLALAKELRYGGYLLKDAAASVGFKYSSSYCRATRNKNKNE